MHATFEREAFLKALQFCDKVVERKSAIPILSNVRVAFSGATATLHATNLDEMVSVTVPAEVEGGADTTAPSDKLRSFVQKLAKGAQIKITAKNDGIDISSSRSRMSLATIPASDFPNIADNVPDVTFTLEAAAVLELFRRPQFAISTEETRYYLNGIFIEIADGNLNAVATDGHRLCKTSVALPDGLTEMKSVIVPRGSVARIIDLAAAGSPLEFGISAAKITVKVGETSYSSKLIDGTFPEWRRVVPSASPRILTLDRLELAAVIDRVSTIATERGRAVKMTVNAEAEEICLSTINPDSGAAEDFVRCVSIVDTETVDPHCTEIGMNARYLIDILSSMTGENVALHLDTPGSPMKLTEPGNPLSIFVLMPMRV
ncbi:DNA polymerase III subunit beta [Phreatobacter sp. HK31-P]